MDSTDSDFKIKTHVFEGPLDVLLSLIEKRKLFINDISLSQVANDFIAYVEYIQNEENGDQKKVVDNLAQFILVASTLVLIKSKSLLPQLSLSEEEKGNIDELEARLKEYQKYKTLSENLRKIFGRRTEYMRLPDKNMMIVFAPDKNTTVSRIFESVRSIIAAMPKIENIPKAVVRKVISLEEMITNLSERISSVMKMSFREFAYSSDKESNADIKEMKINVIVSFLAMLELVKRGIIMVRQESDFDDIEIETEVISVPRY
jgi:segregation and condensation protein A